MVVNHELKGFKNKIQMFHMFNVDFITEYMVHVFLNDTVSY